MNLGYVIREERVDLPFGVDASAGGTFSAACWRLLRGESDQSESRCSSFCNCVILLARTPTHTHRADYFAVALQRNASSENHDSAIVRGVNSKKLPA